MTYRVAAVVVAEPEVAWADKPKQAFARGEQRYARNTLWPFIIAGLSVVAGITLMFTASKPLGIFLFFAGIVGGKFASRSDRLHDPTMAVHEHAQDDLVAWGERIAEAEGPRLLGSAIAGVLFGAAAEREGAQRTAVEYYQAALDDLTTLHPETLVKEVASIAAVRGAKLAFDLGEVSRAKTFLEKRDHLAAKKVPQNLALLPSLMTCKPFAALAADLDEEEKRLYASLA